MRAEGISQRVLAQEIGVSQGHLSKVLRAQFPANTRVMRAIRSWCQGDATQPSTITPEEMALLAAAREAAAGSKRVMHLLTELMHRVDGARRIPRD
jgi:transcriptional regulator with XRE-family HTH domain